MRKLILISMLLWSSSIYAWKEPAWTTTDEGRLQNSDVVFLGTVKSISESKFFISSARPVAQALIEVEEMKKIDAKNNGKVIAVFFEKPSDQAPDRGFVNLSIGQRALFYSRFQQLSSGETVLYLGFQSDVQKP